MLSPHHVSIDEISTIFFKILFSLSSDMVKLPKAVTITFYFIYFIKAM
jgi:hypothetical protein